MEVSTIGLLRRQAFTGPAIKGLRGKPEMYGLGLAQTIRPEVFLEDTWTKEHCLPLRISSRIDSP